jgi:adenylosuccinate synthase
LRVADLAQRAQLRTQLQRIRDEYLPQRLAALGLRDDGRYRGEEFIDQFLRDSEVFADCIAPRPPSVLRGKRLVFEGAQGLLLDQDNRADFPHVTRSHTGLRNVRSLAGELSIDALEVLYVSRSYLTRHGAGPLPGEAPLPDTIHDATNLAHPYQGVLRYAPLDPAALLARITADLAHGEPLALEPRLALTCLDQHPAPSLPAQLQKWLSYSAHGPTQRDVRTLTSVG